MVETFLLKCFLELTHPYLAVVGIRVLASFWMFEYGHVVEQLPFLRS